MPFIEHHSSSITETSLRCSMFETEVQSSDRSIEIFRLWCDVHQRHVSFHRQESYATTSMRCFRLGFVLFLIGLWSAFEHRKITHMPTVNRTKMASLTPFNFMGLVLCIFGLLFFLLCIISCLGINRENLNLLRISLLGQFLTLIVFLISATMILVWGETIRHRIGETMMAGLRTHYHVDEAWTAFFDKLHMSYFCCGMSYHFSSNLCPFNDRSSFISQLRHIEKARPNICPSAAEKRTGWMSFPLVFVI
jgi:hypothetical protein